MSEEVDRKRTELHESNELILCERVESKQKHNTYLADRKQLNDAIKLELNAEVHTKREMDKDTRPNAKSLVSEFRVEWKAKMRIIDEVKLEKQLKSH